MKVWRCENKEKLGPYSSMYLFMQPMWLQKHQNCDLHLRPAYDGICSMEGLNSGFANFETLDRWFTESNRRELRELGYVFLIFDVDDALVSIGGQQVAFPRQHAAIIEEELR